jgi:hypothetical protein
MMPAAGGHGNERLATLAAITGFALLLALDNALAQAPDVGAGVWASRLSSCAEGSCRAAAGA